MQEEIKLQLQKEVKAWLGASASRSQEGLSKLTGVNTSYISQIANRKWNARYPGLPQWNKIASFFRVEHHIDSVNYRSIIAACSQAHTNSTRLAIDGYTGAGKSYALRRYQRDHTNVYLVQCNPAMTRRAFAWELARQVGSKPYDSLYNMLIDVVKKMEHKSEPVLLIFDEIEYLPDSAFHIIKTLMDNLENRVGIVVSGIFRAKVERKAKRQDPGWPQLMRRIEHSWLDMKGVHPADVMSLCGQNMIEDPNVIKWLVANAKNYDALTTYVKTLVDVSFKTKQPISTSLCETLFMQ